MPDAPPADYSVLFQGALVAKVWCTPGHVRRAGARGKTPLRDLAFGDIILFDAQREAHVLSLLQQSDELDAWFFKLKLDGFEVRQGEVRLGGAGIRRF